MSLALHHIANPIELLSKLVQRLRGNGIIVIIDWSAESAGTSYVNQPGSAHEIADAHHTITADGFSPRELHELLASARCSLNGIDVRSYIETSHIPESVAKVKGGRGRTLFIAKGRKP